MKKLLLLLLVLAVAAAAQNAKPSAAHPLSAADKAALQQQADTIAPPAAQPATTAQAATSSQPETRDLSLPPGTPVYMKLETPISTRSNKAGDRFAGRVTQPVMLNAKTIIPVGAALEGQVIRAEQMRRIRGTPVIDLRPELITMPDGARYSIVATIVDANSGKGVSVDDEGRIHGQGHDRSDWRDTAIGSGAGALTGGLLAGGKGMVIGAGIGATASVVRWLTKTKSADLPAGSEIVMELSRPMALTSASSGQ